MPTDLRINTSLGADDVRIQQLRAKQAAIEAEIAALSSSAPTPSTYQQQHRIQKHQRRNSNVPRTMSNVGASMARQLSSDRIDPSQRSRNLSQRSAPAMARTNSRGTSSSQSYNTPFTQTGAIPPPLRSEPRENPTMETWMKDPAPLPSYSFSQQAAPLQRSTSQQKYNLAQVPELVGENPLEWCARVQGTPTLAISPPLSTSSATLNDHLSASSFTITTPSTPTTDSLTTATTLASSMSRQNSLYNEPVVEGFSMMRFASNRSYSADVTSDQTMFDQFPPHFESSHHNRCSSSEEQTQLLVGAGGASNDSPFSYSSISAEAFASSGLGEKMQKSLSNESMSSTSSAASAASRSKQRLQASLAAERPIQPKGGSDENSMSRAISSQSMTRLESKDGLQDKVAISSKPTYQRPKHERVFCKQCEAHPDGFRGEHELRRHQDREHKVLVKKWVCIEPTGQGHPKPELPLSKCKACGVQKKKYGAYYNAAAHLRRTHFKPKAKGARKSSKVDDGEKRGGKAGGDWPEMSELKYWMKEVEEVTEYPLAQSQQDNADLTDDETNEPYFDEQHYEPQTISHLGSNNFNNVLIADASPILDMYRSTTNGMYMQSMPIDLPSQQSSCIDQSMYGQNFSTFSPNLTNDHMAFFNPSSVPQNFDDQFTGQDFVNFPYS